MRIPIIAILGLASLVAAIPVEGDSFARSSTDDPSALQGKNVTVGEISTALDLRSENSSNSALMALEGRALSEYFSLPNPSFNSKEYRGLQYAVCLASGITHIACSLANADAACTQISALVALVLESIIVGNSYRNSDMATHGLNTIVGEPSLPDWLRNMIITGLTSQTANAIQQANDQAAEQGESNTLPPIQTKRSLLSIEHLKMARTIQGSRLEHDGVEIMDVSSLNHQKRSIDSPDLTHRMMVRGAKLNDLSHDLAFDQYSNGDSAISFNLNDTMLGGESELNKRGSSGIGMKISFSYYGYIPDDKTVRAQLAHTVAKQWGETAFSQTGWDDYLGTIGDMDGNKLLKFRIGLTEGEPKSGGDSLDSCKA